MSDYEFLCVNAFLGTEIDARAIKSAMELGLVDALSAGGAVAVSAWATERKINPVGLSILIDSLEINGVVARGGERIELTPRFKSVLRYRDLLESRIAFADLVWPDIHTLFTPLLSGAVQKLNGGKTLLTSTMTFRNEPYS